MVLLGLPQYPVSPGGGPSLGFPSGQRGVGRAGGVFRVACTAGMSNTFLPPAKVTDLVQVCLLPSLAASPSTVMESPGFSVSRVQPPFCRSMGLSSSAAQTLIAPPSFTLIKMWTWGFAQSTLVTMPVSFTDLFVSNFAAIAWWADSGAIAIDTIR